MKYGEGVLYNFVFTELQFKTVSGDVTAFHRIQPPFNVWATYFFRSSGQRSADDGTASPMSMRPSAGRWPDERKITADDG